LRFAVHWPGIPVASPRVHGAPRRDVSGRVHVSIADIGARRAGEARLALARPRVYMSARRAALARVRGWYSLHPAGRLALQPAHQQSPARGEDAPVQASLSRDVPTRRPCGSPRGSGHIPDAEVLYADYIKVAGQAGGQLLGPVLAQISLADPQACDRPLNFRPSARPSPGLAELALEAGQSPPLVEGQPRNSQCFPSRQSRADRHAPVDPDDRSSPGTLYRIRDFRERNMPSPGPVAGHAERLHTSRDLTGPTESDPPRLWDADLAPIPIEPTDVPLLGALARDAEPFMATGFSPRRHPMRPLEETPHGLREVAQRLLLDGLASFAQPWVLGPRGGELPGLLQVARRGLPPWTPPRLLLHRQVPHEPGVRAVTGQNSLLFDRRPKTVSSHANMIANNEGRERRFHFGLARASTPHFQ
jgi:hypothetical protein